MRIMLIGLIMLVLCALVSCSTGTKDADEMSTPKTLVKEFFLKEDLSINAESEGMYMLVKPGIIKADSDGNIYAMDRKTCQITIFDNSGRFLKQLCSKGAGPHEVLTPKDMVIDKDKRIHILDYKNRKIARYNFDGTTDDDIKLQRNAPISFFVSNDGNYFIKHTSMGDKNYITAQIVKYDADGREILKSPDFTVEYFQMEEREVNGVTLNYGGPNPFDPAGYLAFGKNGKVYFGFSDKYEISIFNQMFNPIETFRKNNPIRAKVTLQEKEEFLDKLKRKLAKKGLPAPKNIRLPDYNQFFKAIWINDKGQLLVRTPANDGKVHVDVFESDGNYLWESVINKPSDEIDLEQIFKYPCFLNNYIYTIVQDDEGQYLIKRYKMIRLKR